MQIIILVPNFKYSILGIPNINSFQLKKEERELCPHILFLRITNKDIQKNTLRILFFSEWKQKKTLFGYFQPLKKQIVKQFGTIILE